eukprot:6108876-Alexandrium_andersonii.AAC.1
MSQRVGIIPGPRGRRRRLTETAYPAKAGWGQGVAGRIPSATEAASQEAIYRRAVAGGRAGVASADLQMAMFSGYRA